MLLCTIFYFFSQKHTRLHAYFKSSVVNLAVFRQLGPTTPPNWKDLQSLLSEHIRARGVTLGNICVMLQLMSSPKWLRSFVTLQPLTMGQSMHRNAERYFRYGIYVNDSDINAYSYFLINNQNIYIYVIAVWKLVWRWCVAIITQVSSLLSVAYPKWRRCSRWRTKLVQRHAPGQSIHPSWTRGGTGHRGKHPQAHTSSRQPSGRQVPPSTGRQRHHQRLKAGKSNHLDLSTYIYTSI